MADGNEAYIPISNGTNSVEEKLSSPFKKWINLVAKYSFGRFTSIGISFLLCFCASMLRYNFLPVSFHFELTVLGYKSIIILWYIGAILGSIFCGMNQSTWPITKVINVVGITLIVAGVFNVLLQESVFLMCSARLVAGGCFGFLYITLLVNIGDNVPKNMRGFVCSTLAIMTSLADSFNVFSYSVDFSETYYNWILMAVIIITFGLIFIIKKSESISWYVQSKKIDDARNAFNNLWHGIIDPVGIQNEFDEQIELSTEDYKETSSFFEMFTNGNWKPIGWMLSVRGLNAFLTIVRLKIINSIVAVIVLGHHKHFSSGYFYCIAMVLIIMIMRLIAFIPIKYGLDTFGRKWFFFFGSLSGIPMINILFLPLFSGKYLLIGAYCTIFLVIISGIESAIHVYSTEAFPLNKRNASLAFITSFEYILTAILIHPESATVLTENVSGLIVVFLSIIVSFMLPETKNKSIRECRAEFNSVHAQQMPSVEVA